MIIVAGEPGGSIPAVRQRLEAGWGERVYDHSGMTEIGSLGVEFEEAPGKPFLLEEQCIAEVIDPKSANPVSDGELGELVLTNLGRWDSPLLRYRTGDLVRARHGQAPATAPFPYVHLEGGVLGRGGDMLWIKGNNVYPSAVEAVLREFSNIVEFQLEASQPVGELTIRVETADAAPTDFARRVEGAVHDRLYFRPNVMLVPAGSLPRFEMKANRLIRAAMNPPATDPPSIAMPETICPRAKTDSTLPVKPVAASASISHASTAPEKNVKPSPSSIDATAHAQNGASISHSPTYSNVETANVTVPSR